MELAARIGMMANVGEYMETITVDENLTTGADVYNYFIQKIDEGYDNCIFVYAGTNRNDFRCISVASLSGSIRNGVRFHNGLTQYTPTTTATGAMYVNSGDEFYVFRFNPQA